MTEADLVMFSKSWTTGEYVLLNSDGSGELAQCSIFNQITWSVALIENDELFLALKQRMAQEGTPIILRLGESNPIEDYCDQLRASGADLREFNEKRLAFIEARRQAFHRRTADGARAGHNEAW